MSELAVTDPTFTADYFFVVRHDPNDRDDLKRQLEKAAHQVQEFAGVTQPVKLDLDRDATDLSWALHSFDRQPTPHGLIDHAVRLAQDSVWFQIGCLQTGTFALSRLPALAVIDPPALHVEPSQHYLGLFHRGSVEYEPESSRDQISQLTWTAARHYFGEGPWKLFDTRQGMLAVRLEQTRAYAMLAYPRGVDATDDLHYTLPFLLLCYFKMAYVQFNLKKLLAEAQRLDGELRALLQFPSRRQRRLTALQRRTEQLAFKTAELTDRTVLIRSNLRVLTEDRTRVKRLLAGTLFETAPGLARFLVDDLADHLESKATSELGGREATLERAAVYWKSLGATIELQQANQSSKLAAVMAVLTVVQVFAAATLLFPKDSKWDWENWEMAGRFGLLGNLLLLLVVAFLWIKRPS